MVCEAFQFAVDPLPPWARFSIDQYLWDPKDDEKIVGINIQTLSGPVIAKPGDYIINGGTMGIYSCRADIFKKIYEYIPYTKDVHTMPNDIIHVEHADCFCEPRVVYVDEETGKRQFLHIDIRKGALS